MQTEPTTDGFFRHIRACNNAVLPGERLPFRLAGRSVGWVRPGLAAAIRTYLGLAGSEDELNLPDPAALPGIARVMAERGHYRWRNEAFDVREAPDTPPLTTIDRGAIPSFGVLALGVHVNGYVRGQDGLRLWVARRAANKLLDPSKLDHLVAGGVPAGFTPAETLVKEAEEEAGIQPALAMQARLAGTIAYAMDRAEGLRRDFLYCYDLELPADFVPRAVDGEVEGFELWPVTRVMEAVRETDEFKFNVNLVLIDFFIRHGMVGGDEVRQLRAALGWSDSRGR